MIGALLSFLSFAVRYIGWPGVLLGLLYVYEEGLPGAARVPYLSSVPILGDLTTGRVHTYAADQVRMAKFQAKVQCDADKSHMVTTFERDALAAQLQLERQRLNDAQQVAEEFRKRYTATAELNRINQEKAEKAIAEDNLNEDGAGRVTDDDVNWLQLRHH
jgi:hypothetical protein